MGIMRIRCVWQEFVELVRAVDLMGAITYARRHLAQWAEIYEEDHQRACALLAFRCESMHVFMIYRFVTGANPR